MTNLVIENIRLKELVLVVNKNKRFFDEFLEFLREHGYGDIQSLMFEPDEEKFSNTIRGYFRRNFRTVLYDGIARAYDQNKSKWYLITWILRDAPQQRLAPIVSSLTGRNTLEKRVWLINRLRKFAARLFPAKEQWEWSSISEVML